MTLERAYRHWYKDRDFPEIKSGNDMVIAHLDHFDEQADKIMAEHNAAVTTLSQEIRRTRMALTEISKMMFTESSHRTGVEPVWVKVAKAALSSDDNLPKRDKAGT